MRHTFTSATDLNYCTLQSLFQNVLLRNNFLVWTLFRSPTKTKKNVRYALKFVSHMHTRGNATHIDRKRNHWIEPSLPFLLRLLNVCLARTQMRGGYTSST